MLSMIILKKTFELVVDALSLPRGPPFLSARQSLSRAQLMSQSGFNAEARALMARSRWVSSGFDPAWLSEGSTCFMASFS